MVSSVPIRLLPRLVVLRLALISFLVFLVSCSDNTTDPQNSDKQFDPTGFAILDAVSDTLYWGEEAWLDVNELGSDIGALTLFVHSVEVTSMTIEGKRIRFIIPYNTSTGKIRLYKNGVLAKNDFTLHVFSTHIDDLNTKSGGYDPAEGYPGEVIRISVIDMPRRRREFEVFLDDTKLEVLEWDTSRIVVAVPEGPKKGMLTLRAFSNMVQIGQFEILAHGGRFLDPGQVREVTAQVSQLQGTTIFERLEDNVLSTTEGPSVDFHLNATLSLHTSVIRGDSIYIKASDKQPDLEQSIDIALMPASGRNTVSGRITLVHRINPGTGTEGVQTTTILVKDISWKQIQGQYILYAYGKSISEKVVSVTYESRYKFENPDAMLAEKVKDYTGGNDDSYFTIFLLQ